MPDTVVNSIAKSSSSTLLDLTLDLPRAEDEFDEDQSAPAPLTYATLLPLLAPIYSNLASIDLRRLYPGEADLILPFCTNLKKLALANPEVPDEDSFDLDQLTKVFSLLPNATLVDLEIDFCVANTEIEGSVEDAFKAFFAIPAFKNLKKVFLRSMQDDIAYELDDLLESMRAKGMEVRMTSG